MTIPHDQPSPQSSNLRGSCSRVIACSTDVRSRIVFPVDNPGGSSVRRVKALPLARSSTCPEKFGWHVRSDLQIPASIQSYAAAALHSLRIRPRQWSYNSFHSSLRANRARIHCCGHTCESYGRVRHARETRLCLPSVPRYVPTYKSRVQGPTVVARAGAERRAPLTGRCT